MSRTNFDSQTWTQETMTTSPSKHYSGQYRPQRKTVTKNICKRDLEKVMWPTGFRYRWRKMKAADHERQNWMETKNLITSTARQPNKLKTSCAYLCSNSSLCSISCWRRRLVVSFCSCNSQTIISSHRQTWRIFKPDLRCRSMAHYHYTPNMNINLSNKSELFSCIYLLTR